MAGIVTIFHAGLWPDIAASCICMAQLATSVERGRRRSRPLATDLSRPLPASVGPAPKGAPKRPRSRSGYRV